MWRLYLSRAIAAGDDALFESALAFSKQHGVRATPIVYFIVALASKTEYLCSCSNSSSLCTIAFLLVTLVSNTTTSLYS